LATSLLLSDSDSADIVVAVHVSSLVSGGNFKTVLEFVKMIARNADIDTGNVQFGLVFYGLDPEVVFDIDR